MEIEFIIFVFNVMNERPMLEDCPDSRAWHFHTIANTKALQQG